MCTLLWITSITRLSQCSDQTLSSWLFPWLQPCPALQIFARTCCWIARFYLSEQNISHCFPAWRLEPQWLLTDIAVYALTSAVGGFSPGASRFPSTAFFSMPPDLPLAVPPPQKALSLILLSPGRLSRIPIGPIPPFFSFSLRSRTPLLLTILHHFAFVPTLTQGGRLWVPILLHTCTDYSTYRMTSLLSLRGTQLLIFMSDFPLNCLHPKLQLYLTPAHFLVHSTSSKLFIKNKTLTCQYPDIFWVSR